MDNQIENQPIMIKFENGPLREGSEKLLKLDLLQHEKNSGKKSKPLLVASNGGAVYSGYLDVQPTETGRKNYLCVINKKTRTIENIINIQTCTLKPTLSEENLSETGNENKSFLEKSDRLSEVFGSSREKRAVASRKRRAGASSDILIEKVGDVVKKTPQVNTPISSADARLQQIIPHKNDHAKHPSDVYDIMDIVSKENYEFLTSSSKEMTGFEEKDLKSWRIEEKYPECILFLLSHLIGKGSEIRRIKGNHIQFLHYLIMLYSLGHRDIKKANPSKNIPERISKTLIDTYTKVDADGRNRCLPSQMKDKLLIHILILCLHIEDFDVDISLIVKHLKLGIPRVTKLLHALGCTVALPKMKRKSGEGGSSDSSSVRVSLMPIKGEIKEEVTKGNQGEQNLSIEKMMEEIGNLVNIKTEPDSQH